MSTILTLQPKSLETLKDAASGSTIIYARLSEYLNDIGVPAPRKNPPPLQAYNGPIVWARPNTPIVVHRPFPSLSGKRHIPKLANTNGIPHLRFKKPQSPFLSRVIRDKVKQREARFDTMAALREQVPLASEEDRWDDVLSEDHGIEEDDGDRRISWTNAIWKSHEEIKQLIQASHEKNTSLARKMYEIIEQEKVLAAKEGKSKEAVVLKESKIATELRLQESRGSVSIGAVTPLPLIRRLTM